LAGRLPVPLLNILNILAALYISPMIYGFLLTAATDILRLLNGVVAITHNPPPFPTEVRLCFVSAIFGVSVIITLAGMWNADTPIVVTHDVAIETSFQDENGEDAGAAIKIAAMSDIHLGQLTGPRYLKKLVTAVNEQFPDIVLLLGDTIDSDYFFSDADNMNKVSELLSSFNARLGTWAILGNHDYYVGADRVRDFLSGTGINVLVDEAADVDGRITLAGRADRTAIRYGGVKRPDIAEILSSSLPEDVSIARPLIVMDHQPFELDEAMEYGADLQLSGHTHRGQIFPFNFIIAAMYEKSYGLYKKGPTTYYISSGAGVWGTPVRTAGRSEIVIINIDDTSKGGQDR
jgi:predicted MPP superfamily phosphohydrolase